MKEIMFRAWDNVKNKMYFSGIEDEVVFSFESCGLVATDLTEHDWGFKKLEHLIYMQYTGLKDKNGKEIYVGDVLGARVDEFDVLKCEVVFETPSFCRKWLNKNTANLRGKDIEPLPWNTHIVYEVIGNIHEHSHLLEQSS